MLRQEQLEKVSLRAEDAAEERILDALLPEPRPVGFSDGATRTDSTARQLFRKRLREGELNDKEVELELAAAPVGVEIMAPPSMEEMTNQLQSMFSNLTNQRKRTVRLKVKDALRARAKKKRRGSSTKEDIKARAIESVEQTGSSFSMKSKSRKRGETSGPDVSREGVQRDCCRS
jgi:ATP-dependent HslUV protease ATP-binding subunit HslU